MADTVVAAANGNGVLKPVTKAAVEQSDVSLEVDTTPPAPEACSVTQNGHAESDPAAEPPLVKRGLYFVRVPRPVQQFDDAHVKKLQAESQELVTKLRGFNQKLQAKRAEATGIRQRLNEARSLRDTSSPEFDEKMKQMKQLQDTKKRALDSIGAIKSGLKDLDCKSEQELDAKLQQMDDTYRHSQLAAREEKQLIANRKKLAEQREAIKAYEAQRGVLEACEREVANTKATVAALNEELQLLKGERGQATGIMDELRNQLAGVQKELSDLEGAREVVETKRKEVQEALRAVHESMDSYMWEWRENRKLSVQLRDMVEAGQVAEASKLAEEQVEAMMDKLSSDAAYRTEYCKLWSSQRKYVVSELLPDSGSAGNDTRDGSSGKGGSSGRGKPGSKGPGANGTVPAKPAAPQGAAKAAAIIAARMQEAERVLAADRAVRKPDEAAAGPRSSDDGSEGDKSSTDAAKAFVTATKPEVARVVPGASEDLVSAPVRAPKQHKAAHEYAKIIAELPKVDYAEFVPPPSALSKGGDEQLSEAEKKERVREEQRQKAAEAEARKKRRLEQATKKKEKAAQPKPEPAAAPPMAAPPAPTQRHAAEAAPQQEGDADAADASKEQDASGPAATQQAAQAKAMAKAPGAGKVALKPSALAKGRKKKDEGVAAKLLRDATGTVLKLQRWALDNKPLAAGLLAVVLVLFLALIIQRLF